MKRRIIDLPEYELGLVDIQDEALQMLVFGTNGEIARTMQLSRSNGMGRSDLSVREDLR